MLNHYTKVRIQCPRRPCSKVAGLSPAQHRTIPHTKDVAKFCMTCGTCQAIKPIMQCPAGLLHPLPIPTRPWESIRMDFIRPLPPSPEGYNFIWVVVDRLSTMVHLVALKTSATATKVAKRYLKEIVRLHGVASSIVSDRDP